MCQVPSDERENLVKKWPPRTHDLTQQQIRRQQTCLVLKTDKEWVHNMKNFAWSHQLVNIHETMMVDVLHQLLKRMVMHLLSWVKLLLKTNMPAARK